MAFGNQAAVREDERTQTPFFRGARQATQREVNVARAKEFRPEITRGVQPTLPPGQPGAPPRETTAPTLDDFVQQAQRLGEQRIRAQAGLLRENVEETGEALASKLFGQNIGARGGLGERVIGETLERQARRLEPTAVAVGTQIGQTALQEQIRRDNERRSNLFSLVRGGQLRGEEAESILQEQGIQDVTNFLTDPQQALEIFAASRGMSPEQALQTRALTGQTLIEDITANPERYAGLAPDPEVLQQREEEIAQAGAPKGGKVLCTELHAQGLLSDEIYEADSEYAKRIHHYVISGYHFWAKPLVRLMQKSKLATSIVKPIIMAWAYEMAYKMDVTDKPNYFGKVLEAIGIPICYAIGFILDKRRTRLCHSGPH